MHYSKAVSDSSSRAGSSSVSGSPSRYSGGSVEHQEHGYSRLVSGSLWPDMISTHFVIPMIIRNAVFMSNSLVVGSESRFPESR